LGTFLIVDDHPAIRMAVRIILSNAGHEVCAEADNGVDAVHLSKKLAPDFVVLDIGIPRLDGLEVVERIKNNDINQKVIILSSHDGAHIMTRAFQAGADGFISKMEDLKLLIDVIKSCMNGEKYFTRQVSLDGHYGVELNRKDVLSVLSNRETSVLMALCKGMSNKEIAKDMLLSEKTISTYKVRIMHKLNVENMVELIEVAKRCMVI